MNLQNEIDKKANYWLIKESEGLSKKEENELQLWLQNKNHKKSYEENKQLINECLELDKDFIRELEEEVLNDRRNISFFHRTKYLIASIAILCIIALSTFEINKYFIPTFSQDYLTTNEKYLNISLPDNTIVDLDKNSQMNITYYNTKRVVNLSDGNALFSVLRDAEKPFYVKTKNTLIEVLGTKFEVINFENKITVNVLEGVVQVSHINKNDTQILAQLKKSESFTLNNLGEVLNHVKIDVNEIASWKNDLIIFNKTTLKDAINIFERYSNNKIEFENDKLAQLKISGKFSTLHFDSFLQSIELIYPVKVKKEENNIVKVGKK